MKNSTAHADTIDTIRMSVGMTLAAGAMLLHAHLIIEACLKAAAIHYGFL